MFSARILPESVLRGNKGRSYNALLGLFTRFYEVKMTHSLRGCMILRCNKIALAPLTGRERAFFAYVS